MGQPHCSTCPFIDTRDRENLIAGQEGLCRVLPNSWPKRRLDYDWCGKHPELPLESPPPLPSGFYTALLHVCLVWSGTSVRGKMEDRQKGWKIELYPDKDSYEATYDLNNALALLVRLGQDHYRQALEELKAKDPATPESDGV